MDTVRKDMKQKIEMMERAEEEKRKANDVRIIKCERDFFRLEAIRLNKTCKEMGAKIEDLTLKLKTLSTELTNLTEKWKMSENMNKQLMLELERNIQINRQLEESLKLSMQDNIPKDHKSDDEMNRIHYDMYEMDLLEADVQQLDNNKINRSKKLVSIINSLRSQLKREKGRNHKILGEFNKILLDKNKLENVFIDCVEEARKEIFSRKIRDNINMNSKQTSLSNSKSLMPYLGDIKHENFLSSDKRKLVETFILKDEVINLIRDHVFKKKEEGGIGGSLNNFYNGGNNHSSSLILDNRDKEFGQTKTSFTKTNDNKMFSMTNFRKKTPSTGLTYTMQINRTKTPGINF
jgi:hypothetical protein